MVHARVSEVYINFELMYMTDHIFLVLPIKDMINKDIDPTTLFKLATVTKSSVSHLRVLIFSVICTESYCTHWDKGITYASPSTKGFLRHNRLNYTASKRVVCVRTNYKEYNIFI